MNRVDVRPYALPLRIPYRWSKGVQHVRSGAIVRVQLGEAIGWGECAPPPHEPVDGPAYAATGQALFTGLDVERDDFLQQVDARGAQGRERCGISTAWLAARAAQQGLPLARLIAGPDRRLAARVPVNELITDETPAACVERTRAAIANGQTTVKVKCTPAREFDLARVGAIRAAFPDVAIRIDPNESWPPDWALDQLVAMAAFRIDYCEEPLPRGTTIDRYAELRRRSPIAIALDDSVRSLQHAEHIIEAGAADVLILKAQRIGGPDKTLELIDRAAHAGIRCTVTASLETAIGLNLAVHVAATLPPPLPPCGLGTARFFAEDVATPPPIIDGAMALPKAPGLGCDAGAWWARQRA